MTYTLEFTPQGEKSFNALDRETGQRVLNKLKWFINNIDSVALVPHYGTLEGLFKLKVGDYRVIYNINTERTIITIHLVGHRKEIYR
ncbi:type II toxin-antitoxin system RelE family toxin [Candidatus Magnetomonas plexicatena]|uniref:type II toxin-antitoxin system RelE family toxin n=1 Tax=Candidatus Magnetomonas plexicatena TaxID=2552947 RepID=UPI001C75ED8D|nr:type II toxin-antitoxin system RelE/ParE family toxin [Nitrospirales bacterium LBB_01]